ncbi:MAG: zf-HC2 domain-containing protein [Chrysiogenia bacterium]
MNCTKVFRLLSVYQDGELDPVLERQVESHLRDCHPCRSEWQGLQELVGNLKCLPPPASDPYFPARVMAGLPAARAGKFGLLPAIAYALVFFTIFLSVFFLQLSYNNTVGAEQPQAATFTAVLLENQDLGLLAVHDNTLALFDGNDHE